MRTAGRTAIRLKNRSCQGRQIKRRRLFPRPRFRAC